MDGSNHVLSRGRKTVENKSILSPSEFGSHRVMTVVAVEPFVVGLSVLLVVLLTSVIALRPFVVVCSSVLARPSLVSRPLIKLVRTVVRSIVRPSHFAARSISSRSTADRRSLSPLELVALVDGLVSLSGNRLDSSFLFLVLLVVQVFSTLGLSVDVSPLRLAPSPVQPQSRPSSLYGLVPITPRSVYFQPWLASPAWTQSGPPAG